MEIGSKVHADFHLVLQRELPLATAHGEIKELEKGLLGPFRRDVRSIDSFGPMLRAGMPRLQSRPMRPS